MATRYKQEMPPSGGYGPIEWAKQLPKKSIGGFAHFGIFIGFTASAWVVYYFSRRHQKMEALEMRDARIAIVPLLLAEQDRYLLKQFRENREEEKELMKNVEGWKVGTLWGSPVYHNIRHRWNYPVPEEYFAHCNYWDMTYETLDKMQH